MIYNNIIRRKTNITDIKGFFNRLMFTPKSKEVSEETEDDGFITDRDIIQPPSPTSKEYFVRFEDYEKIKEIHRVASIMFSDSVMPRQEYEALFKYFSFKIKLLGYDASGYILKVDDYEKFHSVYCSYTTVFRELKKRANCDE